jgi:hypothetical protein
VIYVIPSESAFSPDRTTAKVIVESDEADFAKAFHELQDMEAKQFARAYAAKEGVALPAVNGNVHSPYPVNSEGKPLDQVDPALPANHPLKQPFRYRIEVPIIRSFV